MAKKDHRIEITTRNGDKLTRDVSEQEARRLEDEPFRDDSNVAVVSVTKK